MAGAVMTTPSPLRLGIVGLGKMGQLHASAWQRIPGVQLTAMVDLDPHKATLTQRQSLAFFEQSQALVGKVDIAVIATPSDAHLATALPLLAAGVHCLVEKPLALDLASCNALVSCAQQHNTLLAVGQSERFNPAIRKVRSELARQPRGRAEVVRMVSRTMPGPFDADVVQDLMVHDLDWLIDVLGKPHRQIRILEQRMQADQLCHVHCELTFPGDRRVQLTASRESTYQRRQVILHDEHRGEVHTVDLNAAVAPGQPDALTLQAHDFVQALLGKASTIALGHSALDVMSLSENIRQQCMAVDTLIY